MGYEGNGTYGGATPVGGTTLDGGGVGIPSQPTSYPGTPFSGVPRPRRPIGGGPVATPSAPGPGVPSPVGGPYPVPTPTPSPIPAPPVPSLPGPVDTAPGTQPGGSGGLGVAWPTPQPKPGGTPVDTGPYVPPQRQPLPKQPVPTNPYDKIKRPRPIYTQPGAPAGPKPESM